MKFIHIICLSLALSASSLSATVSAQTGTGYFLHTVTKGQSLYSIASMYHISVDDIVRLNPGSKEQIRAGQALKIPQAQYSNEDGKQFHTIQAGETLYQLTLKYHVTAQAICKANPGLSAENFRIGQVIVIPAQDNTPAQTEQTAQAEPAVKKNEWRDMHKVARKETIFSISQQYGITQEELIAANPELKNGKLKKGSFLFIPYPKSQETGKTAPSSQAAPSNEELFKENSISKKQINTIKVALMLPFTSTSQDEQSRMVEFYEGFLMAIDSLKHQGVSADIYTYDTKGTTAGTNAILSQSKLKDMDIELVILAGYDMPLGVIPYQFKNHIIGTFPALYPAFEDAEGDVQRAVLERGVKITGATAYFADADGRVGGIILQRAIEVMPDDTPDSLRRRVLEDAEWKLLSQAVSLYCANRLSIRGSRVIIEVETVK